MLIVSRKPGERIMLGDDTVILVSKVQGKKVILGIEAPKEVKVYREEVYDKVNRELQSVSVDGDKGIDEDKVIDPSKYERMGWK